MAERLFPVVERTASEVRARARQDRDAQTRLFELDQPADLAQCPACAGLGDACTCDQTGAQAVPLFASSLHPSNMIR